MKRPIEEVRKEIRLLDTLLTHEIIMDVAKHADTKVHNPKRIELENRLNELKREYPRWERKPM